jgi:hypothetical protein
MIGDQSGLGFWSFKLRARLVPHGSSFNLLRSWRQAEIKSRLLASNQLERALINVTTNPVNSDGDWDLQIKMIWDRPGPKDYTTQLQTHFRGCPPPQNCPTCTAIGGG